MSDWVRDDGDLLAEHNLSAVEDALEAWRGLVFGWQYHYAGGTSRSAFALTAFDDYLAIVEQARPGDHFSVFDLTAVAGLSLAHLGDAEDTSPIGVDEAEWADLATTDRELVIVRRFVGPLTGRVEGVVSELDTAEDDAFIEYRHELQWGRGERFVFAGHVFDEDEDGRCIAGVSAGGNRRRHALVDAKRPNRAGRVPRSGPY